ncbi:MAG TPA: glycosyl hydrolase family 65 protein [Longimicrobiales bacterium]
MHGNRRGREAPDHRDRAAGHTLPPALRRPFRLIAFDWDGTAVVDRRADATPVRAAIERLLRAGVYIAVITGTRFDHVDRQLSAAIRGAHKRRLFVLTNRGSEVWGFDQASRPVVLRRRVATPEEERRLTAAADALRAAIVAETGIDIRVIYDRLNRRKVDLIPVPEWADPPKSAIGALTDAVESRLTTAGFHGGLAGAFRLAQRLAAAHGLEDARITSDVKHIEIGLTDKADAVDWLLREFAPEHGITPRDVLIGGDEFGRIAGFEGSDARMRTPSARGATFVSVGPEPGGAPEGVIHLGGGPARFLELLEAQAALHRGRRAADGAAPDAAGAAGATPTRSAGSSAHAVAPAPPTSLVDVLPVRPTPDPAWRIVEEGLNVAREHEIESLFAIANGYVGTRGSLAEGSPLSAPATFIAGVFDVRERSAGIPELVVMPDWMRLSVLVDGQPLATDRGVILEHRRILDLRQGLFWREWRHRDPNGRILHFHALRLASLADRHALYQVTALVPENFGGRVVFETLIEPPPPGPIPLPGARPERGPVETEPSRAPPAPPTAAAVALTLRTPTTGTTVAFASDSEFHPSAAVAAAREAETAGGRLVERVDAEVEIGAVYRLDRFVSVYTSRDTERPADAAARHLVALRDRGAAAIIEDHVAAWRERWRTAEIQVDGDDDALRALRFACYHLIAAANPEDEQSSVGARALTGHAYSGHVFWDTEIYMLPFYTHTHPPTARSLLMYRWHTLPAAREKARALGFRGAFYAWESTPDGREATPRRVLAPDGRVVLIRNGEQETHISADIAYGVWQYWHATGDDAFLLDAGAEILLETARFWASRGRLEDDGRFHIRGVIGPDEYHEDVDDDAYTNGMAAWNLERAADVARLLARRWPERWRALCSRLDLRDNELREWRRLADAVHLGSDPRTGVIEQFEGYFALEEIDVAAYEPRTAPMDVILGPDRTRRSQVIKQPDVLMLIYLLWDRFPPRVREANFRYYDPRTGHGSSLSPSIHALLAARLGDGERAKRYFRQAAEIDLADNMGNAAGGVHAASLGGLWQAAIFGFAGTRLGSDGPAFEPRLPHAWRGLRFPLRWRDATLRVSIDAAGRVSCDAEPAEPPE